jgi:hypothetical protein
VNKKRVAVLVLVGACFLPGSQVKAQTAAAQQPAASSEGSQVVTDQDIALMRADIRSAKKQLIAENLKLTDAEATKFWPIYDKYASELRKIGSAQESVKVLNWRGFLKSAVSGFKGCVGDHGRGYGD